MEPTGSPRDSATIILLRDRAGGGFELFLMRRHRAQTFMAGAHVFPGGSLAAGDCNPLLVGGFSGAGAQRLLQEPGLSAETAVGLFLAAIRETFEEAGVLIARDASGDMVDLTDPARAARFAVYRRELQEERLSLEALAEGEGIRYAPDLLVPYAHWITPTIEPRRFDTRFFLARLPEGQVALHDSRELTQSCWLTPADALREHAAGRIVLMPPTLVTVAELAGFSAGGPLVAAARSRRILPILPEAFRRADCFGVLLPNDAEYPQNAYRRPPRPGQPSRVVMRDGIWRAESV